MDAGEEAAGSVAPDTSAAVAHIAGPPPRTILKRRDFLACARDRRWSAPGVVLQARDRGDDGPPRVGYTCSKKVGNAAERNRAKRRLREAARAVIPGEGRPGWDYVLIGKRTLTATRPFTLLVEDLRLALGRVHAPRRRRKN